jgi:hypothetical protein
MRRFITFTHHEVSLWCLDQGVWHGRECSSYRKTADAWKVSVGKFSEWRSVKKLEIGSDIHLKVIEEKSWADLMWFKLGIFGLLCLS